MAEVCPLWVELADSQFPTSSYKRFGSLLHLLIIDFVSRVARPVIIDVFTVKEEDDWNSFARVVEMVATVEESMWVGRIIVATIESNIEIVLINRINDLA